MNGFLYTSKPRTKVRGGCYLIWNAENPFPWLDEFTQGNMTESNFFESTVKEYSTGSLEW